MHALHSLAHRAPPATRTRVRWQPYSNIPPASCSITPSRSSPYLNTPSSVSSSPPIATPATDLDRIRQILPPPNPPTLLKERDIHRNKYAISLVDQAVKSLCEIWRPQDIPPVFVASAHTMISGGTSYESPRILDPKKSTPRNHHRNTQLPSPISPSTHTSPSLTSSSSLPSPRTESSSPSEQDIASTLGSRGNLVPIKSFVHEVLRRSRTSGCVLQTALCYLEAIRAKVPDLVRQEKNGEGVRTEPDTSDRITPATEAELEREAEFYMPLDSLMTEKVVDEDTMPTARVHDNDGADSILLDEIAMPHQINQKVSPGPALPALPPLPSPLLCPRRAFLASLILASKFSQDKCYSNRAWAKLSGLPPREIGRCERALGEALEWRLWVGKQPVVSSASTIPPLAPLNRPVMRTQSESSLFVTPSSAFLVPTGEEGVEESLPTLRMPSNRGLRRCSTLPAEAYSAPVNTVATSLDQAPWRASTSMLYSHDNRSSTMSIDTSPDQLTHPEPLSAHATDLCPSTSAYSHYSLSEKMSQSPSPETPGLSYSPSSTESCSGDRTIQMSTFPDDSMGSFNASYLGISTDSWPWLDSSDMATCLPKTASPPFLPNAIHNTNQVMEHFGPLPSVAGYGGGASLPFQLPSGIGDDTGCPWVAENGVLMYQLQP